MAVGGQYQFTSAEKNKALCRKDLDMIPNGNFLSKGYEECRNMKFFRVFGLAEFWEKQKEVRVNTLVSDLLASCVRHGVPFAFVIRGDERGIGVYVGTLGILLDSLQTAYEALYPGIDIAPAEQSPLRDCACQCGGLFTGTPTDKTQGETYGEQVENLCRGMLGTRFTYVILASGISSIAVSFGHDRLLEEMESTFSMINQNITGGAQGNLSIQRQDFASKDYFDHLQLLEQSIKTGVSRGMWRVNGYYACDTPGDSRRMANIIKASFSGKESGPEPFRVLEYNHIRDVITNTYMMADLIDIQEQHPLGLWTRPGIAQPITLFIYKFQTILNSDQLAVMCQLPIREFPGYYIDQYVEFDVSQRNREQMEEPVELGEICQAGRAGRKDVSNRYSMEKNDFTRHALVIGITGGGKTNTSKSLLNSLWNPQDGGGKIPFLVIESAKREYWELRNLKGFEDLLVFTLGSEATATSVKYRINPFETLPGISLQTHIDYLMSTFNAAFDLYPPMPYILEKAVYQVYSDRGWDIVENQNRYGLTEYPTLTDLYNKIDVIVDNMGYHQEVQSNVKAALQARVYSLMIGGKGAMLNTPRSVPIQELLARPAVLELEDLGDDETKSFVIGILLVQLYEYRKTQMSSGSRRLSHILMVEEAHRLLKNVSESGEGGNTRAKSVEFFCNLLAEIRTFGQGIMIADQIPTKLAPDTLKNTNLKIVHRTVAREDRETIGRAMNMTEEQIEYLSSLRRGYAAVYAEGDNRPKCVKMPLVSSYYAKTRQEVIREVREKVQLIARDYDKVINHHAGCSYCEHRCQYFDKVSAFLKESVNEPLVLQKWKEKGYRPASLCAFLHSDLVGRMKPENDFEKRCILGALLQKQRDLNDGQRQQILADYLGYIHQ